MNSSAAPQRLPDVQAAAVELDHFGYVSVEPGWAVITLEIVRAVAAVHPELVPQFTSKWASMQLNLHPEDLAASLRVRLAGAVLLAEKSKRTCRICGKAAAGVNGADSDREIDEALCAEHWASAGGVVSTAGMASVTTGVPQCATSVRRIGGAVRRAIRRVPRSAAVARFSPDPGRH